MYAGAISPCRRWRYGDENGADLAGVGGSDPAANPGPTAGTAANHWRGRSILPHLANRRDAAPHGTFGGWADRKPEAGSRATLLPERDHAAADLPPLVRSPGGGLGFRNPPPSRRRRGQRAGRGIGETV